MVSNFHEKTWKMMWTLAVRIMEDCLPAVDCWMGCSKSLFLQSVMHNSSRDTGEVFWDILCAQNEGFCGWKKKDLLAKRPLKVRCMELTQMNGNRAVVKQENGLHHFTSWSCLSGRQVWKGHSSRFSYGPMGKEMLLGCRQWMALKDQNWCPKKKGHEKV